MNFINKKTNKQKGRTNIRQELEREKSSKTVFRVLEFLSKIPNTKKIFNEHFNLCEAEISLDEMIKF